MMKPLHGVNPAHNSRRHPSLPALAKCAAIASVLCAAGAADAKIVYVNSAIATPGNGAAWSSSYKYLQDALANTGAGDAIYIARGTYYPDQGKDIIDGDREKAFVIKGQKLYGGCIGSEVDLTKRNPQANLTKLSGAIWEGTTGNAYWSLHVLVIEKNSMLDGLTVAEGKANGTDTWSSPANQFYDEGGGCIVKAGVSLNLNQCILRDNEAFQFGGAIALEDTVAKLVATDCLFEGNLVTQTTIVRGKVGGGAIKGNVEVSGCRFINNQAETVNGVEGTVSESRGGAILGNVIATKCQFSGNLAIAYSNAGPENSGVKPIAAGGAVAGDLVASRCVFTRNQALTPDYPNSFSNPTTERTGSGGAFAEGSIVAVDCAFIENNSSTGKIEPKDGLGTGGGGAIYVKSGKSSVTNCVFVKNSSGVRGGAIHSGTKSFEDSLTVRNCTFLNNEVADESKFRGAALSVGGIAKILNNIFWQNEGPRAGFKNNDLIHVIYKGTLRNSAENYPTPADTAMNLVKGGEDRISEGLAPDVFLGDKALTITSADPLFTNPADLDGVDNIWGTADDGLRLQPSSGAIGTKRDSRVVKLANFLPVDILDSDQDGDIEETVSTDFAGFARFQNSYLDMGAYEFGSAINAPEISISQVAGGELTDGSAIPFGTVKKGAIRTKTFVIKNIGTNRLSKISYIMTGSRQITVRKPFTNLLNPGATVQFSVVYNPTSKGKQTAALQIVSNDADESPFDINFNGTGKVKRKKSKAVAEMVGGATVCGEAPKSGGIGLPASAAVTTKTFEDGKQYLVLTTAPSAGFSQANGTVEVSSDLLEWSSGAAHTTTLVDSPTVLTVRDNTPLEPGKTRYIRLR